MKNLLKLLNKFLKKRSYSFEEIIDFTKQEISNYQNVIDVSIFALEKDGVVVYAITSGLTFQQKVGAYYETILFPDEITDSNHKTIYLYYTLFKRYRELQKRFPKTFIHFPELDMNLANIASTQDLVRIAEQDLGFT